MSVVAHQPTRRRFEAQGLLAIEPKALAHEHSQSRSENRVGDVTLVFVRGPLLTHDEPPSDDCPWTFDSYESLKRRVVEALDGPAKAVALVIDSPGGHVAGLFDTVQAIKVLAARSKKPLVGYVEGQACSAAYALACACSSIFAARTAVVGSIGLVDTLLDQTALDAGMGLQYHVVASGARKADGNPHVRTSTEAIEATKSRVDKMAAVFFELVAEARGTAPGRRAITARGLAAQEASLFVGQDAVRAGLADGCCTLDELVSWLSMRQVRFLYNSREWSSPNELSTQASVPSSRAQARVRPNAHVPAPPMRAARSTTPPKPTATTPKEEPIMHSTAISQDDQRFLNGLMAAGSRPCTPAELGRLQRITHKLAKEQAQLKREHGLEEHVQPSDDTELGAVDRAMGVTAPPVTKAQRAGTTLYLGRAPEAERRSAARTGGAKSADEDPELAHVDRMMRMPTQPSAKCEMVGATLYLGRAPR